MRSDVKELLRRFRFLDPPACLPEKMLPSPGALPKVVHPKFLATRIEHALWTPDESTIRGSVQHRVRCFVGETAAMVLSSQCAAHQAMKCLKRLAEADRLQLLCYNR